MKYYSREIQNKDELLRTAGVKARDDADAILSGDGWEQIVFQFDTAAETKGLLDTLHTHFRNYKVWADRMKRLKSGDTLLIQFPIKNHSVFISRLISKYVKKGVRIVLLIHDLESIRLALRDDIPFKQKLRLDIEEGKVMKSASTIIVHNDAMKKLLISKGYDPKKLSVLGLFDYLIPDFDARKGELAGHFAKDKPVIIAGNLKRHKAEYVYHLPQTQQFNLYGIGYEDENKENICYHGSFEPDDLPFVLEGSFGLVWDGECAETCSGVYGQYLKVNNPHKTSLYLATGIPVIVWKQSALAPVIEKNGLGIAVQSLHEIPEVLAEMTDEEYANILAKTAQLSGKLRRGGFLRHAAAE